jgi:hypothetical protein
MVERGLGNEVQARDVLEQVASATIRKWVQDNPHTLQSPPAPERPEIPAPLKWGAVIVSGLMTAGTAALFFWMVSTLNALQLTVARIDERQAQDGTKERLDKIEERLTSIERRETAERER